MSASSNESHVASVSSDATKASVPEEQSAVVRAQLKRFVEIVKQSPWTDNIKLFWVGATVLLQVFVRDRVQIKYPLD